MPCCPRIRPSCVYYNFDNFTFSWSATFSPSPRSHSTDSSRDEWRPSSPSVRLRSRSVDRQSRSRHRRTAEGRSHRHVWSRRSLSVSVVRASKRRVSIASFRSASETEAPRPAHVVPEVANIRSEGRERMEIKGSGRLCG